VVATLRDFLKEKLAERELSGTLLSLVSFLISG
jgi:hypothetical protein